MQHEVLYGMLVEALKPLQSRGRVGPWVDVLRILARMSPLTEVRALLWLCCSSMSECLIVCS